MTDLTAATFADLTGEDFVVTAAPEGTVWTLTAVEPFDRTIDPAACRRFSLTFRGARDPVYAQQIVPLRHPRIGEHGIFVVPIGRDDDGVTYEAVFN